MKRLVSKHQRLPEFTEDTNTAINSIHTFDNKLSEDDVIALTKNKGFSSFAGLYYDIEHTDEPYIYSVEFYIYRDIKIGNNINNYVALYVVKLEPNEQHTNATFSNTYKYISAQPAGKNPGSFVIDNKNLVVINNMTLKYLNATNYKDAYIEAKEKLGIK